MRSPITTMSPVTTSSHNAWLHVCPPAHLALDLALDIALDLHLDLRLDSRPR